MRFYVYHLVAIFFLIHGLHLSAQEVIVRFQEEVQVLPDAAHPRQYISNTPAIRQVLQEHPPQSVQQLLTAFSGQLPPSLTNIHKWKYDTAEEALSTLEELRRQPGVVYAELNHAYRVVQGSADPFRSEQWYLNNIHGIAAWDIETGDESVLVGVIDTGVDYLHEDLQSQVWINSAEDLNHNQRLDSLDLNGVDDDGNGYVDDVIGWDFTDAPEFPDQGDYLTPDPDPMDEFAGGHGTVVAGIIAAARNNNVGISGIAPGVRVMALRAGTASGFLEEDDVAEAILYAIDNGCKVINMSFGDVAFSFLLRDAIQYGVSQGVLFVASAGNSGTSEPNYPAAFDETISVGATTEDNGLAGFSNYGSTISLVAPGAEIFSTKIGNQYGRQSGTSFSAPMVSAALALLISHYPDATPPQLTGALLASATDLGFPGWDAFYGHGLLNVAGSLQITEQGYVEIISPASGSGISQESLPIIGTVFGPNLESFALSYGVGENPGQMNLIQEVSGTQLLQDTLAIWDVAGLADTTYTLELRLHQFQQNDLVKRTIFVIDRTAPQLIALDTIPMLSGSRGAMLFKFTTDDPSEVTISLGPSGSLQFPLQLTSPYFRREHHFLITQDEASGTLEFFITLRNAAGLTSVVDNDGNFYSINLNRVFPEQTILQQKETYPFSAFFLNTVTDIDSNQFPEIVISELGSEQQFGALQVREFRNQQFELQLSTDFPAIPRDVGQVRPDGGMEILGGFGGTSFLLGGNAPGEFPSQIAWFDTTNFWGSRLADFDGDGKNEMLALKDNQWRIFDISSTYHFTELQILSDTAANGALYGVPRSLFEDLDNDGFPEIVVDDVSGKLYIYERQPDGQYRLAWSKRMPGKGGAGLFCAADITGNGQRELVVLSRNEPANLTESNADTRFWALTVWQAQGDNDFQRISRQNIHNVTAQTGIHNGVTAADLDGDQKSEIILTPFPRLYVFRYESGDLHLLWYQEGVNSNSPVAADLDNNGRADLLVNSEDGIIRFEGVDNSNRPPPPLNLTAVPLDTALIRLSWEPNGSPLYYRIYRRIEGGQFSRMDSTSSPAYQDSTVSEGVTYHYVVTGVDSTFLLPESPFSNIVGAVPNSPPQFLGVDVISPRQLRLRFNESMSDAAFDTRNYQLSVFDIQPASALRGKNRREVLLSFVDALPPGEYQMQLSHLTDRQGTPLPTQPIFTTFQVTAIPTPFYLTAIQFLSKTHLVAKFNHPVDPVSAANAENYIIEPDDRVLTARVDSSDSKQVHLFLSGNNRMGSLGVPYYVTVQNLTDLAGVPLQSRTGNRMVVTTAVDNLERMRVYPNPYNRHLAQQPFMFANLPQGSEIFIFSASGRLMNRLKVETEWGGVPWNLQTSAGDPVGSGVYLYIVRFQGQEKRGKFIIIK